jgi:Ca-activated chloride channel family protein
MTWLADSFAHPWILGLLAVVPILLLLGRRRRSRDLASLMTMTGGHDLSLLDLRRRAWLRRCFILALVLLIVGSAGPRWGRDPFASPGLGRDILVALDVSRSMLAEDYPPQSRLQRALSHLDSLGQHLLRKGGHRIGLIVFAAQARLLLPLTDDYEAFRYALAQAHPDLLPPEERVVFRDDGTSYGTSLRSGLEAALHKHDPAAKGYQEILLVTDGDDLAGDWEVGVETLRAAGVPVTVLAVGDPVREVPIPTGDPGQPFVVYQGKQVRTRRHDEVLLQIATRTGGVLLQEEQGLPCLPSWLDATVSQKVQREWFEDRKAVLEHHYQWLFLPALLLLMAGLLISDRGPRRK